MKRITLMSLVLIILASCSDQVEPSKKTKRTKINKNQESVDKTGDLSNPAIMQGSDLGSIIRKAFQVGNYDLMIQFTADSIVSQIGKDELKECYRNLDMGKEIKLKSITTENDTLIMNYEAIYRATKEMIRLPVIIENDTAKICPTHPCKGSLYD